MRKNDFKDSRLLEAFDYIDPRYIAEVADSLKLEKPAPAARSNRRTWRHILALAACILVLGAIIPVMTYIIRNFTDIAALFFSETTAELTEPETPPEEATLLSPETTGEETTADETTEETTAEETTEETTAEETTAEETTAEETTAEETTAEETTAPPEPEYDGSRGLEYQIEGDHAVLVGIGTCTDKEIIVASTYNGLPVTSVDYSFSRISNVTSITLSDSVLTVGRIVSMPDLVSVYFSKSVTEIDPESLIGCPNLVIIEVDKGNPKYMSLRNCLIEKATKTIVHGCKGSVIPTDGSVTVIGEFAFHGCDLLTELTIPEGIERIDAYAFGGCDSLKKVNLPDSLTYLGFGAFFSCEALERISLGSGLETVGGSAFADCPNLMELTFPKTTKLLCELAFFECKSLTKISYEGTMAEWQAIEKTAMWSGGAAFSVIHCSDGELELYEYDGSRGLEYKISGNGTYYAILVGIGSCTDEDIVVGSYYNGYPVRQIDQAAFANNTRIKSVTISDTVTRIGFIAFSGCTSLESIYISASVNDIDGTAFWECPNITSIVIDPDNKYYEGNNCIIEKEHKMLFLGCKTTVIPSDGSVTYIEGYAFYNISGITSVTIPEGVTDLGMLAFYNCPDLREVYIPSTLVCLGGGEANAFDSCDNIEKITVAANNPKFYSVGNCVIERGTGALVFGCAASVIPNDGSVKIIDYYAFGSSDAITEIVIPEGVTEIRWGAFDGCTNLKKVSFPKSLTKIDWYAFSSCSSLESVTLGENVTYIGTDAFRECVSLKSVRIPGSVEFFGNGAFTNCTALESVTVEKGLTYIPLYAFSNCQSLTEFVFTGSVDEWSEISKGAAWNENCPFTEIRCSDGNTLTALLSDVGAIEAARKYWGLENSNLIFVKSEPDETSPCYKLALCEWVPDTYLFEVKKEIFVNRNTGECSEAVYEYPDIPEVFRDVIFNKEKIILVTMNYSYGAYSYTTEEIYLKDAELMPSLRLGEESCLYGILDINGDSSPELVFTGMYDNLILRVYEGRIYGYSAGWDQLYTDGSFSWHERAGWTRATSLRYFDGVMMKSRELVRWEQSDETEEITYFVEDKETTKEEYEKYESSLAYERVTYKYFDLFPIYLHMKG